MAFEYEWIDNWARLPDNPTTRENGRTHGVVVANDGHVLVFCQGNPAVLVFDSAGLASGKGTCRPPGVRLDDLRSIHPPHLRRLRSVCLASHGTLALAPSPRMQFVFLGPELCMPLPSDPASPRRPCASANGSRHKGP